MIILDRNIELLEVTQPTVDVLLMNSLRFISTEDIDLCISFLSKDGFPFRLSSLEYANIVGFCLIKKESRKHHKNE